MRTHTQIFPVVEEIFLLCLRLCQTFCKLLVALARHPAAQSGRFALCMRFTTGEVIELPLNLAMALQIQPRVTVTTVMKQAATIHVIDWCPRTSSATVAPIEVDGQQGNLESFSVAPKGHHQVQDSTFLPYQSIGTTCRHLILGVACVDQDEEQTLVHLRYLSEGGKFLLKKQKMNSFRYEKQKSEQKNKPTAYILQEVTHSIKVPGNAV